MKKSYYRIKTILIVFMLTGFFSLISNAQAFVPNDNQVCFYENDNYTGAYICLNSTGEYRDLGYFFVGTSNRNWHDKISSVIIGRNACAILYEHPNNSGYCLILRGNGVSQRRIPKLSAYNFNDKASHIKSLAYPDNLPPEPYQDEVIFFEHSNFDGYFLRYPTDLDLADLTRQNLEDPFTGTISAYNWNDRISSMKIGAKSCITGWININYSGQKWMYRANGNNCWNITDMGPLGSGDKFSSFKIRDRDHCIQ